VALTELQKRILRVIAEHRTPDSHVAGGTALMADRERYSSDIDIFHDASGAVATCAASDVAALKNAGFTVDVAQRGEAFIEADVSDENGDFAKLQWAVDSAVRFFPAVKDAVFGYRLHELDLAVNKVLAMAGRREPRDYYDVVRLHEAGIALAALAWAAPGKDAGFTPELVIDEINRNSSYTEDQMRASITSAAVPDLRRMKATLLAATSEARALFPRLPLEQVGQLYLGPDGRAVLPDPEGVAAGLLTLHGASARGAWPRLTPAAPGGPSKKPQPRGRTRP
jgi:hypothetical protein